MVKKGELIERENLTKRERSLEKEEPEQSTTVAY